MNRINTEAVGTKKLNTAGLTVDFTRRASNRAMLNGQIRPHRGMARRPRVEIEDGKALLPYDLALHLLIGQKADSKCFRDNYAKCDKPDNYAKWYTRQPEN